VREIGLRDRPTVRCLTVLRRLARSTGGRSVLIERVSLAPRLA
jgi:hypothetical protein